VAENHHNTAPDGKSYLQILKSTSLMGASSVVIVALSIIRMKIFAIALGPAGVGLYGLYSLVADFAANLAGMGIQSSGIREVAEAAADGDANRVARICRVLTWLSLIFGIAGAAVLAALAVPVARLTFGSSLEAPAVAALGLAVILRLAAGPPTAMLNGHRRIGALARMTMLAAVLSTLVTIGCIWVMGAAGIVPSLIATALTGLAAALWYARTIAVAPVTVGLPQAAAEARVLLRLGLAFLASALLTTGSAYAIRIFILQMIGVEAAGLYQAAWALGGLYAGFILQAMGTDFYPRLTGVARNNRECNRLVNEQAEISLLLAGPGVLATMTLAPLVMSIFYSAEFAPAVAVLRWICLGMLLRIVAWPMGFIVLAKGAQKVFFWTELAAAIVQVGLAFLLLHPFGLAGAGMAFFGLYLWHGVLIYWLVGRMSGFRWTRGNLGLGAAFLAATGLVFMAVSLLPPVPAVTIGVIATATASLYSMVRLMRLLPARWLPPALRALLLRGAAGPAQPPA
jgi:PST family polysaccharide transporter